MCENYSLICTVLAICFGSLNITKGAQQEALQIKRKSATDLRATQLHIKPGAADRRH